MIHTEKISSSGDGLIVRTESGVTEAEIKHYNHESNHDTDDCKKIKERVND